MSIYKTLGTCARILCAHKAGTPEEPYAKERENRERNGKGSGKGEASPYSSTCKELPAPLQALRKQSTSTQLDAPLDPVKPRVATTLGTPASDFQETVAPTRAEDFALCPWVFCCCSQPYWGAQEASAARRTGGLSSPEVPRPATALNSASTERKPPQRIPSPPFKGTQQTRSFLAFLMQLSLVLGLGHFSREHRERTCAPVNTAKRLVSSNLAGEVSRALSVTQPRLPLASRRANTWDASRGSTRTGIRVPHLKPPHFSRVPVSKPTALQAFWDRTPKRCI